MLSVKAIMSLSIRVSVALNPVFDLYSPILSAMVIAVSLTMSMIPCNLAAGATIVPYFAKRCIDAPADSRAGALISVDSHCIGADLLVFWS